MRLVDQLLGSIRSAMLAGDGSVAPVAILWTDADAQWAPLAPLLRSVLPSFFTLGPYDRETRTGPAIWLKCIVDRKLTEAPAEGEIPLLYLPRVSRQELRAAGDCPPALQPLVELQYRGRIWHQPNGHDWSVRAFLVSDDGLGLDVAGDRRTEEAFLNALEALADIDVKTLKGRRLEADDFDKLLTPDPERDLLRWLDAPEAFEVGAKGSRWDSFRGLCQSEFGFDPDRARAAEVAARLLRAEPALERVWNRFAEAPHLYAGAARLLREPAIVGQGALTLDTSRDPRVNEQEEAELRRELERAAGLAHAAACKRVLELEACHGPRRGWVWARLDWSPWARALEPLARLAQAAGTALGGATLSAAASAYAESGWRCDQAAMRALASFRTSTDAVLMAKIVQALYGPWLELSARHFQSLVQGQPEEAYKGQTAAPEKETCLVFADGLRYDLAGRLAELLEARAFRVKLSHRLAPLPTVTPTGKPAAAPLGTGIRGDSGENFTPLIQSKSGWKPITAPLLREKLEDLGVEVLDPEEIRISSGGDAGGWTECGLIDDRGHSLQGDLVHQLEPEVQRIAERVVALLDAGWRRVRVVTDHGWLLLPEALPKVDLPQYLVETKWARCALVKGQAEVGVPVYPWRWNQSLRIASPPGDACFRAGERYAHGGVSPQECVVPEVLVELGFEAVHAVIVSVEWRGMRCRIRVETNDPKVRADLRTNWKLESTSIAAAAKEVGAGGEVSLAVPDDNNEGAAAAVVLLDSSGRVVATQTTSVGEQA
jgi:hypothetical protein